MEALTAIQDQIQTYLDFDIWGMEAENIAISFGVLLGLIIIFKLFRAVILTRLQAISRKTKTDVDNTLADMIADIPSNFYWVISLFVAFQFLQIEHPSAKKIITAVFLIFIVIHGVIFLQKFIGYVLKQTLARDDDNATAVHGIRIVLNIALWSTGILLVLQNLGFQVSTLVASLGIGGIAIAFALQNILGDLFSSFAIYFDKPFQIGDYIVLGTDSGTVKKIGMKTTRITTLQGEELVVSNAELTSARIKNFKRMKQRRIMFRFGVTYETPTAKLKKIPAMVEKIIEKEELADADRIHFKEFGDFSLNFEVVYYVKNREYKDYMDTQQSINLGIKDAFEKAKIEMAFPTQTIYVQK